MPGRQTASCLVALSLCLILAASVAAADDSLEAWTAIAAGGHIALVRHGNAPPGYGGDSPGFKIDDRATQRNMDERGRAQSRAVGEAFRQHGGDTLDARLATLGRLLELLRAL